MNDRPSFVPLPRGAWLVLSSLPLPPLGFLLQRLAKSVGERRPALFARLDEHAQKVFLIDPTDLPFVFRLEPRQEKPRITPCPRDAFVDWDARIAGSLGAFLALVHGVVDGDALFFSRDIVVEGDTEAVLALRNALDDAEFDLLAETAVVFGPASAGLERIARRLEPLASRLTGLALTRWDRGER